MATRVASQPRSWVGPENPKPGMSGITTWKALAGSPPWARGSVSGPISPTYSTNVFGQPWMRSSGVAAGSGDRTCTKWMFWPSIVVVKCGWALSSASTARQSNSWRQRSTSSRT